MNKSRRNFLTLSASALVAGAGCTSGAKDVKPGEIEDGYRVVAGPDHLNVFEPREVTIQKGEKVVWEFASTGHNVSCVPEDANEVKLPNGAEPFSSYGDDPPYTPYPKGEKYEHRFETPGKYVYVCVPHISFNMIGTVVVEE